MSFQQLKEEEQKLRVAELELKVLELKRPAWRKVSVWSNTLAILIALGGVLGQNILSGIQTERAHLELDKAEQERELLNRFNDSLGKVLYHAYDSLTGLNRVISANREASATVALELDRLQNKIEHANMPKAERRDLRRDIQQLNLRLQRDKDSMSRR